MSPTVTPTRTAGLLATVTTPIGPFTVLTTDPDTVEPDTTGPGTTGPGTTGPGATGSGATGPGGGAVVLASGWTHDPAALLPQVATALRPAVISTVGSIPGVTDAVLAYHQGDLTAIDGVLVRQHSAAFRSHAWDVLRTVTAGRPVSYTEYAALAGRPAAVRAAAGACAYNAVALFVPCHRILRSDESLGGFRWGLPVKQWLLAHEARR